jgi:hypothetical protein
MGIVGHHPESGMRIEVERHREGGPPWRYEGECVTPSERFRVAAVVDQTGNVAVELPPDAPAALAERTRLIVRTAYRHACGGEDDAAPPRRIVRWRADR